MTRKIMKVRRLKESYMVLIPKEVSEISNIKPGDYVLIEGQPETITMYKVNPGDVIADKPHTHREDLPS